MSTDSYYTPADLADELVGLLPRNTEGLVVDPAMGEGALLRAAKNRFGNAVSVAGIDLDFSATGAGEGNGILASRADFLSSRARNSTTVWRSARASAGAIVLNPPFSTRGMAGQTISFAGRVFKVGPALYFLLTCLRETQPSFGVAAILPAGAVEADRYAALWRIINERYVVEFRKVPGVDRFSGARVAAYLVYLSESGAELGREGEQTSADLRSHRQPPRCVEAIRGRLPVHRQRNMEDGASVRFLHSTDLGSLPAPAPGDVRLGPAHLAVDGPFLALRRVGGWRTPTFVEDGAYVLSDCVIALRPVNDSLLSDLLSDLDANAGRISAAYGGTGAKYITMRRLALALADLGWRMHSRQMRPRFSPSTCETCALPAPSSSEL